MTLEKDPWASPGPQDGQEAHEHDAGVDFGAPNGDEYEPLQDPQIVDAEPTPPRKKKVGPALAIAAVAVVAIGVAGSGMYGLYRKIVPAPQEVASAAGEPSYEVPVEPAKDAAPPAQPPAAAAGVGLPGVSAGSEATTIGAAPAGPAVVDTANASLPAASVPAGNAAAASPPAPAPAAVAVETPPAAPASVAAAPAPAVPQAAGPAPVAVAPSAVAPVVKTPEKAAAVASAAPDDPAASSAPATTRSKTARKPKAQASGRPARASAAVRASRKSESYTRLAKSKPAKTGRAARDKASHENEPTEVGLGVLTGYRIESIEPNFGKHQIAWIRGKDGRLSVVTTGDALDGGRVLKVDGGSYSVRTTLGEIR